MFTDQVVTVSLPSSGAEALWEALTAAGRSLTGATRVVVVRGDGVDFLAEAGPSSDEPPESAIEWLSRPDLVAIAAISGRVAGAGLDVALACDLRVAAHDAQLAPSRSITGIASLGELMGRSRALSFVVAGAAISGLQAAESGLTNMSVDSQMLDAAVTDMVATVLRTPREVATLAKAVLIDSASHRRHLADELAAGIRLAANEP